jgi:hypothetical protein
MICLREKGGGNRKIGRLVPKIGKKGNLHIRMPEGCRCQTQEHFLLVIVVMQVIDWFGGVWSQLFAENMMDLGIPMKFQKR